MASVVLLKFIHVIFGVTFFGGLIGSYFYTSMKSDDAMRAFIFENTAKVDLLLFVPMILVVGLTGSILVIKGDFTFSTPWIIGAYGLLAIIFFLTLASYRYKKKQIKNKMYHTINIAMIFFLVIIVHDAVMKHSLLDYILR